MAANVASNSNVSNPDVAENASNAETMYGSKFDDDFLDDIKLPDVSSPKPPVYNWVDMTESFAKDCKLLDLGQLVHDDMFGLFEGMSAVEMMDPKMDAGMICNQTQRKIRDLTESLSDGTVRVEDLSHAELIAIFDDTLACFVTWMEGHSLAQTIFINLYLHDPLKVIIDPTLKAFSVGILRLVEAVKERVNRAGMYEEEDFQPMAYSFKMADQLTDSQVFSMLRDAEENLNKTVRAAKPKADSSDTSAQDEQVLRHSLAEGMHARVKYLRTFLQVIYALVRDKQTSGTASQSMSDAQKHLMQMKDLMSVMRRTLMQGVQRSVRDGDESCVFVMGFEPLINQRLLPPTFPRYTQIRGRTETFDWLDKMNVELQQACSVTEVHNVHELIEFCCEFSSRSPCLLSRSLLQLIILPQCKRLFGSTHLQDSLRDTLRWFSSPPSLMPKCSVLYNNPHVKECMDAFLVQAIRPITFVIQVTGHNHARQRDKWTHTLDEWASLQEEAERLDAYLHSTLLHNASDLAPQAVLAVSTYRACVGVWTLYHTLQVMLRYTLSGLELELYAVHEYRYVYWYLAEGIYSWLISALARADSFVFEHEGFWGGAVAKGGSSGKKNRNKKQAAAGKVQKPHQREVVMCQALQSLCGGYYKALIGMEMEGRLVKKIYEFDKEEVRYTHRFSPFQALVTPPPLSYNQYLEMTDVTRYDPPLQPSDLYSGAARAFQQARTSLESLPAAQQQQRQLSSCGVTAGDVQTLLRIAKTNFIVMRLLNSGHGKESKRDPEFDFSAHKHFPIIKLS